MLTQFNEVDPITYNIHRPADKCHCRPDILPTQSLHFNAYPQPEDKNEQDQAIENATGNYMD